MAMNSGWLVIRAPGMDVYRHLAAESLWLDGWEANPRILLMFWQSHRAVVIGKNQNPWREVRVSRLAEEHCDLARRVTGGGAVFHDEGNLNVSLILPRNGYRREQVLAWFCEAFRRLGLEAHAMGQTNLGIEGNKVSGHAFAFRGKAVLHHATVLVNAKLSVMENLLRKGESQVETLAVSSTPAPVANLCDWNPELNIETVVREVESAVTAAWGQPCETWNDWSVNFQSAVEQRAVALRCWSWVYGQTPPFTAQWDCAVVNGRLVGWVRVVEGVVEEGDIRAVRAEGRPIALPLKGVRFDWDAIGARLQNMGLSEEERESLLATLVTV